LNQDCFEGASVIRMAASGVPFDFFMAGGLNRWKKMTGAWKQNFLDPGGPGTPQLTHSLKPRLRQSVEKLPK
jgi:hypothetical protein